MITQSPLRYPGGKGKLFPFVRDIFVRNDILGRCYREPYAGGAGLALNLLFGGYAGRIGLNDVDPSIYAFWFSVTKHNREFCEKVQGIQLNVDEWHKQHAIWKNPSKSSELDLGFATYFLNRTNRSGIIEGAGPIGGYSQAGNYKIDARFNKHAQLTILKDIGRAADLIEVTSKDAREYISCDAYKDDFLYLDPPYYIRGRNLYRNFYEHADHVLIGAIMERAKGLWIISYDDVPQIRSIYDWATPIELSLGYSAGSRTTGKEVIYVSSALSVETSGKLVA